MMVTGILVLFGCASTTEMPVETTGNYEEYTGTETEYLNDNEQTIKTLTESEEENMDANVEFFLEELSLSQTMAEGAAKILEKAGCGKIVNYENKTDAKNAYTITLINDKGDKFNTAFDLNGYIGPVKDEKGNYLYSPID